MATLTSILILKDIDYITDSVNKDTIDINSDTNGNGEITDGFNNDTIGINSDTNGQS